MTSCIYQIRNIKNNNIYIGSTVNFERRKRQHLYLLRHNKHNSRYLQNSWNKHTESNFLFEIVEHVIVLEQLIIRENHYLQIFKPSYNMNKVTPTRLGSKLTLAQRKRLSVAHKGLPSPKKGIKTNKPAWNSGKTGVYSQETILKFKNRKKSINHWTPFKKGVCNFPEQCVQVKCIEKNIVFKSLADAARYVNNLKGYSNIWKVCKGKQKTAYGFTWTFMV
jgi:group I intron endonuclease